MRRTEIDVAKGFALFLVVFAHVMDWDNKLTLWIFMFHMPAFFFLSGMTFKPEKYSGITHFFKEKWKKRIVPYLIITFIGFIICMLRADYRQPIIDRGWGYLLASIFFYGQPKNLYIGQVWFLVGLFSAELYSWLWFRFFGKQTAGVQCLSLFVLAWMAMNVSKLNEILPVIKRLPWKLDTALCAAIFLIAGHYAAKTGIFEKLRDMAWFLIPFTAWLSYYYGPKWYGYVNLCDCAYSPGPYFFPVAFLGIAALFLTADVCKKSRFWQYCGRYSLPMFAAQTFAIYWVVELIAWRTGVYYEPRDGSPGYVVSMFVSVTAFALMAIFVYPWHRYKEQRM